MTTNYRRGYEAERVVKELLEARGWTVCRAGASKGPFDLIALPASGTAYVLADIDTVLVLQVKSTHNAGADIRAHVNRPSFIQPLEEFLDLDLSTNCTYKLVVLVSVKNRERRVYFFQWAEDSNSLEEVIL